MIVLSSCHTADGELIKNSGYRGMTRSLFLGGAKNVVSSLWAASEKSSIQILPTFLNGNKEGDKYTDALALAQRNYLNESSPAFKHPYYWANFNLYGQINPKQEGWWTYVFLLGSLIIIGLIVFLKRR